MPDQVGPSNSLGPMWCAPHIEGQYLQDRITSIVLAAHKASNPGARDWFNHGLSA